MKASRTTRTEFRLFPIPAWEQEQDYLRRNHQRGWKLVHVSCLGLYRFEACAPEDVVYQLDYNPDGAAHRDEYIQLFRDCGWEYIQDCVGYSYFRKRTADMRAGDESIFCDDASRLEMMQRVFTGRMIPLLVIFFCLILPQLFWQAQGASIWSRAFLITYAVLFVLYLFLFLSFGLRFYAYWKNVQK